MHLLLKHLTNYEKYTHLIPISNLEETRRKKNILHDQNKHKKKLTKEI